MTSLAGHAAYIPPATSGPYPARPGNLVRPLVDGEETMRRIGEAIEGARHGVWLTVAFFSDDFLLPDGRGPLFDVLDRAVNRGLDVRLLIWRPNPETAPSPRMFGGTPSSAPCWRAAVRASRSAGTGRRPRAASIRRAGVIDAGQPSETSFVGGLDLTGIAMGRHDVYVEVTGPSATDVRQNFVERWNEASERHAVDGNWARDANDQLPEPDGASGQRGPSTVQIQRMLDPSRYAPARVERSILEQYHAPSMPRGARSTLRTRPSRCRRSPVPGGRGRPRVVSCCSSGDPRDLCLRGAPRSAGGGALLGHRDLGRHPNFTLAGIAEPHAGGRRAAYVHTKMMLIDDAWTTIGSCNLHPFSLGGNSEMNASIWDADVARDLRCRLFAQHLGVDTRQMDDRVALRLFQDVARGNQGKMEKREPDWKGLAFALSPETYGRKSGVNAALT